MVNIGSALIFLATTLAYTNAAAVPIAPSPTGPMTVQATPATQSAGDMQRRDHHHHHGHHHDDRYDPNHSQHWNYHHGYTNEDGHGHHDRKMRRSQLASLRKRVDSESARHTTAELLKVKTDQHKLQADLLKFTQHEEKRSHSHSKGRKGKGHKKHGKGHKKGGKLRLRSLEEEEEMVKRSHHHHHGHSHEHSHSHSHSHSHNHARDGDVQEEELVKRSHNDKYYGYSGHRHRHSHGHRHSHSHSHSHNHARDLLETGVPGFVEVATPIAHSALAKSFAGLVFTAQSPDKQANFSIGTSDQHSTQFNLVPAEDGNQDSYRLKIPILDSQTLKSTDYCATFSTTPPSPLALEPCGAKEGYSQNFAYNTTSGQLSPVYHDDSSNSTAAGNSTAQSFKLSNNNAKASKSNDDSLVGGLNIPSLLDNLDVKHTLNADADDMEDDDDEDSDSDDTSDAASFKADPQQLKADSTPTADLYFVPASSYYADAKNLDEDDMDAQVSTDAPVAAAPQPVAPVNPAPPAQPIKSSTSAPVAAAPPANRPVANPAAVPARPATQPVAGQPIKPAGAVLADAQLSPSSSASSDSATSSDVPANDDDDNMEDDSDDDFEDSEDEEDMMMPASSTLSSASATQTSSSAVSSGSAKASKVAAPQVNLAATPCPMEMASASAGSK